MKLNFFKPNWLSLLLFFIILLSPTIDNYSPLTLIFAYIKLSEFIALIQMLAYSLFIYLFTSLVSHLIFRTKNKFFTTR